MSEKVSKVAYCSICGKSFEKQGNSRQIYCSEECIKIARRKSQKAYRYKSQKEMEKRKKAKSFNIYVNHL